MFNYVILSMVGLAGFGCSSYLVYYFTGSFYQWSDDMVMSGGCALISCLFTLYWYDHIFGIMNGIVGWPYINNTLVIVIINTNANVLLFLLVRSCSVWVYLVIISDSFIWLLYFGSQLWLDFNGLQVNSFGVYVDCDFNWLLLLQVLFILFPLQEFFENCLVFSPFLLCKSYLQEFCFNKISLFNVCKVFKAGMVICNNFYQCSSYSSRVLNVFLYFQHFIMSEFVWVCCVAYFLMLFDACTSANRARFVISFRFTIAVTILLDTWSMWSDYGSICVSIYVSMDVINKWMTSHLLDSLNTPNFEDAIYVVHFKCGVFSLLAYYSMLVFYIWFSKSIFWSGFCSLYFVSEIVIDYHCKPLSFIYFLCILFFCSSFLQEVYGEREYQSLHFFGCCCRAAQL